MSDLRAAVEGLREQAYGEADLVYRKDVLNLIPEGAVLVTEETLAAALASKGVHIDLRASRSKKHGRCESCAPAVAAIIAKLREGT